jgi:hypothetical protein
MIVAVLGAGATRGASFVGQDSASGCLPPLDSDFFTQLQRIASPKHQQTVTDLLAAAVRLYGHNFSTTLESLFTSIEFQYRIASGVTDGKWGLNPEALRGDRTALLQGIAAVLEESLTISDNGGTGHSRKGCTYHDALVGGLAPRDAILSFNYDCLIDDSLKRCGDGKWNPRYGYELPLPRGKGSKLKGEAAWMPGNCCDKQQTVRLLKLHGSLNFGEGGTYLKERPYTKNNSGNLRFEIIPPEWNKPFEHGIFARIWRQAARAIHSANVIVVIGYSFPKTDLHASSLFRMSTKPESLDSVVLVNPDRDARHRALDALRPGLQSHTRVIVYESFQRFAAAPRRSWDGTRWKPATATPSGVVDTEIAQPAAVMESAPTESDPK